MASIFDKQLEKLGIGKKGKWQKYREENPVLKAMFERRQPTYDEIKEQERLNREAGVTYPRFQGSLKQGQSLRNIGGLTYVVEDGAAAPTEETVPTPRGMNLFEEALSLPDEPAPPTYQGSMPERRPMQPPMRSEQGLFNPPQPQMQPPTIDTTIDDLMSQLQGYGRPPTMPDFDKPAQRDLGLPDFTTPGFAPPGLMTPQLPQPNVPQVAMQPNVPDTQSDMYTTTAEEAIIRGSTSDMTDEEFDAYINNYYNSLMGR